MESLAAFILGNYKQIQQILDKLPIAIAALQSGKAREDTDYHQHLETEQQYLAARWKESDDDAEACDYVERLIKYHEARLASTLLISDVLLIAFRKLFDECAKQDANPSKRNSQLCDWVHWNKLHAFETLKLIQDELHNYENSHNILQRWSPESTQWKHAVEYLAIWDYQKALDKLKGLVIQWLYELAKMGLSGTGLFIDLLEMCPCLLCVGYKLHTHINKSLKTRCKAIQTALHKYNAAAKAINRPQLDWSEISMYGSLAKFELLRECQEDIRLASWADSKNRQAAIHALKIERAKEERLQLNMEIQRLITYMRDDEADLQQAIDISRSQDPLLVLALQQVLARCIHMNDLHCMHICCIGLLPCFTGSLKAGQAEERLQFSRSAVDLGGMNVYTLQIDEDEDSEDSEEGGEMDATEDDWAGEQLDALNTFMLNLSPID